VASKVDLLPDRETVRELEAFFGSHGHPFCAVSAVTGEGLDRLKDMIADGLAARNSLAADGGKDPWIGIDPHVAEH
jgi:GTP-binding protein